MLETSPLIDGWQQTYDDSIVEDQANGEIAVGAKVPMGYVALNHINYIASSVLIGAPFVFALTGWTVGLTLCLGYGLIMGLTASWLCRTVECAGRGTEEWPPASLPDLCRIVFKSEVAYAMASWCFCLELFGGCVSGTSVLGDQLNLLFPMFSANTHKLLSAPLLVLFSCIPPRYTHFSSSLGIVCGLAILFTIIFDGLSTPVAPGSLLQPADTRLFPEWSWDGLFSIARASGIVVFASAGHCPLPPLYLSMKSRVKNRDRETVIAFGVSTLAFVTTGAVGYLMFGSATSDQITKNLDDIDLSPLQEFVNTFLTFFIAFIPFTVVGQTVEPLVLDIDLLLARYLARKKSERNDAFKQLTRADLIEDFTGKTTKRSHQDIPSSSNMKPAKLIGFAPESPRFAVGSNDTLVEPSDDGGMTMGQDDDNISVVSDVPSYIHPLVDPVPVYEDILDLTTYGGEDSVPRTTDTETRRVLLRVVITCLVVGVSVLLPSFSFVSAIVGASVVCIDSIVLPALCFIMVAQVQRGDEDKSWERRKDRISVSRRELTLAWMVMVAGVGICGAAFYYFFFRNYEIPDPRRDAHADATLASIVASPVIALLLLFPELQRLLIYGHWLRPFWYDVSEPCERGKWRAGSARNVSISTEDGVRISGWHILPMDSPSLVSDSEFDAALNLSVTQSEQTGPTRKLWIYFHGNYADRGMPYRLSTVELIKRIAPNDHVLVVEYRGFGDSQRVSPTEKGLKTDAIAAWKWATSKGVPFTVLLGKKKTIEIAKSWMSEQWDSVGEMRRLRNTLSSHAETNRIAPSPNGSFGWGKKAKETTQNTKPRILIVHGLRDVEIPNTNSVEIFSAVAGNEDFAYSQVKVPSPLSSRDGSLFRVGVPGRTKEHDGSAHLFLVDIGTHNNLPTVEAVVEVVRKWTDNII
ncbi:hypothetical protein HDU93_005563 [Gonapodya sp. JEL0774]|nr:hypothetical protein HDU93_005563 [Gonapodya sp. JEL0774]